MEFFLMLFVGLVIGILAHLVSRAHEGAGAVLSGLLGMAGALFAGFLGQFLGWYGPGESAGFVASTAGAIGLLAAYRVIVRKSEA
jgi:uncharacterized membrane protein YeaQ/YmgE (transglycosylase-associated protein family)